MIACFFVLAYGDSDAQNVLAPNIVTVVDSVVFPSNMINLFKTTDIKDLKVGKNEKYPDGALYITLKDPTIVPALKKGKVLSLKDIADKYVSPADKGKPIIYVLDNRLLTDTAHISISAEHYYGVEIHKASETRYFKQVLPNVLLLMISTIRTIK